MSVAEGGVPICACARAGASAEVCPYCGATRRGVATGLALIPRWLKLLAALVVVTGVAIMLKLASYDPNAGAALRESACSGGTLLESQRIGELDRAVRVDDVMYCTRIDPILISYVEVGKLRVSGNETFMRLTETDYGHFHLSGSHDDCKGLRDFGANGYIVSAPSRELGSDSYELTLTAVVAHAGRVSDADRAAYFSNGRACLIAHVTPGWQADEQGLRGGDLVARIDHRVLAGRDPQVELLSRTRALRMGETLELEVLRHGKLEHVALTRKDSGLFGYHAVTVPILDAALQ